VKQDTFEKIAEIISEICEIESETLTPDKNALLDLDIDSLDFLDITFEIDEVFGIKLPVAEWTEVDGEIDEEEVRRLFRLESICDYVDYLVANHNAAVQKT